VKDRSGSNRELIVALITVILISVIYTRCFAGTTTRAFDTFRPFKGFESLATLLFITIAFNQINKISFHRRPPL